MKKHIGDKQFRTGQLRPLVKITPIAVACATLLMQADMAFAQQAATETVVVTGIRRSIETAIAVKRESDSIVEAVSSEDLGKLPDTSIAESLARLPGLTAQRVAGRDQVLSIRGMASKFAVTLLNGREMVSTGDNRGVEYDQIPSELMSGATVYKTPDASLGAQGLAGTVDLKTVKPLDFGERAFSVGLRGERNSFGAQVPGTSADGNRISVTYVDQFADRTVGVALGFAHLENTNQERYFKNWWWGNSAIWWGAFRGLENADPAKAPSTLQGFDAGVISNKQKRDGLLAVLEYKPNKDFHSQLDLYYSQFSQSTQGREYQANLMPDWSGNGTPDAPATGGPIYSNITTTNMNGDAVVTSGTVTNVDPFILTRYGKREDKISALGWNNELKVGDWKATADVSYSKATRDELVGEMYAAATAKTGFDFISSPQFGFSRYTPIGDYSNPSVVQLRGISEWGDLNGVPTSGSLSPIKIDDQLKALRLSGKRDLELSIFNRFEGGINYSQRTKSRDSTQTIYAMKNGNTCMGNQTCLPFPAGLMQAPVDLSFAGAPKMVSFDMMSAIGTGLYNSALTNLSSMPGRKWGVDEKVTTAFAKLGMEFNAGVPVTGNVGLQVVRADQSATGVAWDATNQVAVPMKYGKAYTDVLPSLNLAAELTPTTKLRFGLAQQIARPNMDDMRAGFVASVAQSGQTPGKWSGSGGNPFLEPFRANAVDLSLEKYIGKRSYLSAAAFYKELKNSIYKDNFIFDFTGFPDTGVVKADPFYNNIGTLSAPVNNKGGHVTGYELAAALEGNLLTPALDGFGVMASYSHTESNLPGSTSDGGSDLKRSLEGLSGDVYGLTAYYEKNGWQARVAQRYRSKFSAEVRGVWIDKSMASIEAESVVDLQLGYSWETGPLKGFSVLLQVNNATNTPYRTSLADDSSTSTPLRMMPERYYEYGRRYLFGINYKL